MDELGPLFSFLSSVTWALGVSVYARVSQHASPTAINWTRVFVAFPVFLVWAAVQAGGAGALVSIVAQLDYDFWAFLGVSVFCSYAAADILFLQATRRLGPPTALAIASVYPLWSALLGAFVNSEALGWIQGVGVLAVVGGVAQVVLCDRRAGARLSLVGLLLALIVSVLWSVNTWSLGRLGQSHSLELVNFCRMGLALLVIPIVHVLMKERGSLLIRGTDLRNYGLVFVVEAAAGAFFFVKGLALSPLAVGSALSSLAPVLVVPFAILSGVATTEDFKKIPGLIFVVLGLLGLLLG
jgi:drug/metabolite transporter (DMT)-like permease